MTLPQYPNLGTAMQGACQAWCQSHGYSDPFCRDGEWWAFPPQGVMPVRVKTVMEETFQYPVQIGRVTLTLRPDGSLATQAEELLNHQR